MGDGVYSSPFFLLFLAGQSPVCYHQVTLVDMHSAISPDDLLADGVHPTKAGMEKMAGAWFRAMKAANVLSVGK